MARDDLQWLVLNDFSPGIYGDIHGGVANSSRGALMGGKNGAATIDKTYRCGTDQFGALVPLAAATTSQSSQIIPSLDNTKATSSFYPSTMIAAYLVDAVTFGPYSTTFDWPEGNRTLDGQFLTATCWFFLYQPGGTGTAYRQMYLVRMYYPGGTWDLVWDSSGTTNYSSGFPHQIAAMTLAPRRMVTTDPGNNPHSGISVSVAGLFTHAAGAMAADELPLTTFDTDYSDQPNPTFYPSWTLYGGAQHVNGYWVTWPNPGFTLPPKTWQNMYGVGGGANPADLEQFDAGNQYGGASRMRFIVSHQGRLIALTHRTKAAGRIHRLQTTYILYTLPFHDSSSGIVRNATFYGENSSDVMLMASLNTDELLMIRNSDGGLLIRGDIDNPTVVRLRNLESMYGVSHIPINSSQGLVYGTPNGVFAFQGGEVAVKLSEQIEGFFWDHRSSSSEPEYESQRGRFGIFHHYVCVPNNFIYDTRSKSWWRLSNPADRGGVAYNCYTNDPVSGDLQAFPYKLTGTQNVVWDTYHKETLAGSYSWQSQPLVETLDRSVSFRSVRLVASPGSNTAACSVVVTLTGFTDEGVAMNPIVTTFQFSGDGNGSPVIQHITLTPNFTAMYAQVLIEASAASGPAPKIISVQLSHAPRGHKAMD